MEAQIHLLAALLEIDINLSALIGEAVLLVHGLRAIISTPYGHRFGRAARARSYGMGAIALLNAAITQLVIVAVIGIANSDNYLSVGLFWLSFGIVCTVRWSQLHKEIAKTEKESEAADAKNPANPFV
jgi:hypothetical protein